MDDLKATIVEHLKTVRGTRRLSLEQAAELTGISKAMLSQLERGQSVPTITTLWKISTGYRVPLTYFLEQEKSRCTKIDTMNTEPIFAEDQKMRTYTLFPYSPVQNFEMLYIELDPGCVHESEKHLSGVEEYVFLQRGCLELQVNQDRVVLTEKQCFRFQADVPHSYRNVFQEGCGLLNLITYPAVSTGSDGR